MCTWTLSLRHSLKLLVVALVTFVKKSRKMDRKEKVKDLKIPTELRNLGKLY